VKRLTLGARLLNSLSVLAFAAIGSIRGTLKDFGVEGSGAGADKLAWLFNVDGLN
jgi:hypothetical protein